MFLRRDRSDRDVVPERDGVVVEGKENLLAGVEWKSQSEEERSKEPHDPMIRFRTPSGKIDLLVSLADQIGQPELNAAGPR
jgi:hypothetical protein